MGDLGSEVQRPGHHLDVVGEQVGGDEPDDLELEPVRVLAVQALGRAVVGGSDEGAGLLEPGRQVLQVGERLDLPRQVVKTHGRLAGARGAGVRPQLEQAEVMIVGRAGRLEERGTAEALGGHVDLAEAQDVAVELDVLHRSLVPQPRLVLLVPPAAGRVGGLGRKQGRVLRQVEQRVVRPGGGRLLERRRRLGVGVADAFLPRLGFVDVGIGGGPRADDADVLDADARVEVGAEVGYHIPLPTFRAHLLYRRVRLAYSTHAALLLLLRVILKVARRRAEHP